MVVGRARDVVVGGAQRRRPALAQIVEIGLARLDAVVELGVAGVAADDQEIDRHADAEFERMVESIEISPILSAS